MGRKIKYSAEQKIEASKQYLSGKKTALQLERELGMGKKGTVQIVEWAKRYKLFGAEVFEENKANKSYSKEVKLKIIQEYLSGKISYPDLARKHKISSDSVIMGWVKRYNNHIEIEDYDPAPEVYMAKTKGTTFEERVEIVNYCLENNRDYKKAAQHYDCNYAQVRRWILKYEQFGKDGLLDCRGKRKAEETLTELEKANRRITQLEHEKEEFRKRYELLKKAEQRERW